MKPMFRKITKNNVFFKHFIYSNLKDKQKIDSNIPLTLYEEKLVFTKRKIFDDVSLKIFSNYTKNEKFVFELYEYIKIHKFSNNKQISLIVKNGQFVNSNTILGYFESISEKILNWLKIKITLSDVNNLFFIRKQDCFNVPTNLFSNKEINDIINETNITSYNGKILDKKDKTFIVQKGFPYFFLENFKKLSKNGTIIQKNKKIGELVFKKEITGDIVQGLPRIEQIFEARKNSINNFSLPKIGLNSNYKLIKLFNFIDFEKNINFNVLLNSYILHYQKFLNLYESSHKSLKKIQNLILNLIQSVYLSQNVSILDKHLEIIIKQMTTRVKIIYSNKSYFTVNTLVELNKINYINALLFTNKEDIILYEPVILGITNVSLLTNSFLSSASFQETTSILSKSALYNKIDWLRGLKENVIIGHIIPAGTGFIPKQNFNYNFFLKSF
jgi:DNA-directed RNA polymerase subunit beta'